MDRWELAKKCVRIEQAGGSVREYLKGLGFISPWGTWFRLQREELGRRDNKITDGKGRGEMGKMEQRDRDKAVQIAIDGGNPLVFLKEIGIRNPSSSWAYIKKVLKETDPEQYEKLEAAKNGLTADVSADGMPVATCCARSTREGVEVPDVIPEELAVEPGTKPLNYAGFDVTGIRAEYGEFKLSCNGYLFFGANDHDKLEMPVEVWRKFAADLPLVMGILGIKA